MSALTSFSRRFAPGLSKEQLKVDVKGNPIRCVEIPKEGLEEYINRVAPHYRIYDFTRDMIQDLTDCYLGLIDELFINIPPRFGKTSLLELFCAWAISNDPRIHIGYCGYNKDISADPCRNAREYFVAGGGELNPAQAAKINWETKHKGKMWSAGFGATARGRGYHIGIVDDAHKDSTELLSEAAVRKWQSFVDKLWPNRAMVHTHRPVCRIWVGQRLGDNDVFGYMLSKPDVSKYTARIFDLIRDTETPFPVPEEVTIRPDRRKHGEVLCPEICTAKFMAEAQANEDELDSQYQQRPRPVSGTIINTAKVKIIHISQVPMMLVKAGGADLAISKKQLADSTAVGALGYGVDGKYYQFPPYHDKKSSPDLRREVPIYLRMQGVWAVGVDSVAYQASFVDELKVDPSMMGITVFSLNLGADKTDKILLARGWSYLVEQELFYLVEDGTGWTTIWLKQARDFPRPSVHDDLIDMTGYEFKTLRLVGAGADLGVAAVA